MFINAKIFTTYQDYLIENEKISIIRQSGKIFFSLREIINSGNLQLSSRPLIDYDLDIEENIYIPRFIIKVFKYDIIDINISIPLNKEFDLDKIILDFKKVLFKEIIL